MKKWMTANAYSQRELVADISPDVARCTVSAEIRCGLSGEAICRLVIT